MSRDVNGVYTLPAGNPVVSGTTITSTPWGNPTFADIATALSDSLSRTGNGRMSVPFAMLNGTVSLPAYTFVTQTNMGLYYVGTNEFAVTVGGVKKFSLGVTVTYAPDAGSTFYEVGFRRLPFRVLSAAGSLAAADSGKTVRYDGPGTETLTVENLVALDVVTILNEGSGPLTIAENLSGTMIWMAGAGSIASVGSRTLAVGGVATIFMIDADNARIWGNGLT